MSTAHSFPKDRNNIEHHLNSLADPTQYTAGDKFKLALICELILQQVLELPRFSYSLMSWLNLPSDYLYQLLIKRRTLELTQVSYQTLPCAIYREDDEIDDGLTAAFSWPMQVRCQIYQGFMDNTVPLTWLYLENIKRVYLPGKLLPPKTLIGTPVKGRLAFVVAQHEAIVNSWRRSGVLESSYRAYRDRFEGLVAHTVINAKPTHRTPIQPAEEAVA